MARSSFHCWRVLVALATAAWAADSAAAQYLYNPYYRAYQVRYPAYGYGAYLAYYAPPAAGYVAFAPPATTCTTCTQQVCRYVPQTCYRAVQTNVPVVQYQPVATVDPCTGCPRTCWRPVTSCLRQTYYVPYTTYHRVCQMVAMPTTCHAAPTAAVAPAVACAGCGVAPAYGAPPTGVAPGLPAPSLLGPPPSAPAAPPPTGGPPAAPAGPPPAETTGPSGKGGAAETSVARPPTDLKPLAPRDQGKSLVPPPLLDPRQKTAAAARVWHYTAVSWPLVADEAPIAALPPRR